MMQTSDGQWTITVTYLNGVQQFRMRDRHGRDVYPYGAQRITILDEIHLERLLRARGYRGLQDLI
jgi:hypothetical protein